MDVRPGELVKLRKIADKQTTDKPAAAHSNCDVIKDSTRDRHYSYTTSKAVAAVFCRMPSQSHASCRSWHVTECAIT